MTTRQLVTVSAGTGNPSATRMLADRLTDATTAELGERGIGVDVRRVELRDHAHDIVNMMLTGHGSQELTEVIEVLTRADGVVLVTPLYQGSMSGLFKSFLDVIDKDHLRDMPVVLGATGGTERHSLALEYAIRPILTYLHADTAVTSVFAATDDWAGKGDQVAPLPRRIERAARELAEKMAVRENSGPADPYAEVEDFATMMEGLAR